MEIQVNGEKLPRQSFDQELAHVRAQNPGLSPDAARNRAADELIGRTLIQQNAFNSGVAVTSQEIQARYADLMDSYGGEADFYRRTGLARRQEKRVRQDLRDQIRSEKYAAQITSGAPVPTKEEIDEHYRMHETDMIHPAQVHASHIVKPVDPQDPQKTYREMVAVRMELLEGADFAEVANRDSSCEDRDGDLGTFSPGKMVEEFDIVVFSMTAGEISPVFRTQFGYHVVQVWDARPERKMTREEAEETISEILQRRNRDRLLLDWIAEKRKVAVVETKD